jgi:hypothetical protein
MWWHLGSLSVQRSETLGRRRCGSYVYEPGLTPISLWVVLVWNPLSQNYVNFQLHVGIGGVAIPSRLTTNSKILLSLNDVQIFHTTYMAHVPEGDSDTSRESI